MAGEGPGNALHSVGGVGESRGRSCVKSRVVWGSKGGGRGWGQGKGNNGWGWGGGQVVWVSLSLSPQSGSTPWGREGQGKAMGKGKLGGWGPRSPKGGVGVEGNQGQVSSPVCGVGGK